MVALGAGSPSSVTTRLPSTTRWPSSSTVPPTDRTLAPGPSVSRGRATTVTLERLGIDRETGHGGRVFDPGCAAGEPTARDRHLGAMASERAHPSGAPSACIAAPCTPWPSTCSARRALSRRHRPDRPRAAPAGSAPRPGRRRRPRRSLGRGSAPSWVARRPTDGRRGASGPQVTTRGRLAADVLRRRAGHAPPRLHAGHPARPRPAPASTPRDGGHQRCVARRLVTTRSPGSGPPTPTTARAPPAVARALRSRVDPGRDQLRLLPGRRGIPQPYAYVGPWTPKEGPFWNQPFGAARTAAELATVDDVLSFFEEGRSLALPG